MSMRGSLVRFAPAESWVATEAFGRCTDSAGDFGGQKNLASARMIWADVVRAPDHSLDRRRFFWPPSRYRRVLESRGPLPLARGHSILLELRCCAHKSPSISAHDHQSRGLL